VLQGLYSIRSERLLIDQLEYNLLYRWFVGPSMDEAIWRHSSYTKNRERLIRTEGVAKFFERIRGRAEDAGLLSDEHFTGSGEGTKPMPV
jgi:transposase